MASVYGTTIRAISGFRKLLRPKASAVKVNSLMIFVVRSCELKCVVCLFAYIVWSVSVCCLLVCMACFTINIYCQIMAIIPLFYVATIKTLSDKSLDCKCLSRLTDWVFFMMGEPLKFPLKIFDIQNPFITHGNSRIFWPYLMGSCTKKMQGERLHRGTLWWILRDATTESSTGQYGIIYAQYSWPNTEKSSIGPPLLCVYFPVLPSWRLCCGISKNSPEGAPMKSNFFTRKYTLSRSIYSSIVFQYSIARWLRMAYINDVWYTRSNLL